MPTVKLTISVAENNSAERLVVVDGEGFTGAPANARVGVRIKGDDEWFDETLFGFNFTSPVIGGRFTVSQQVPKSKLNEDWGQDEIYALAKVDGYGDVRSNTVRGYY